MVEQLERSEVDIEEVINRAIQRYTSVNNKLIEAQFTAVAKSIEILDNKVDATKLCFEQRFETWASSASENFKRLNDTVYGSDREGLRERVSLLEKDVGRTSRFGIIVQTALTSSFISAVFGLIVFFLTKK